jgi:hypothetical protein
MTEIDERYKRGQIYTIRCKYDDDMIYVGSTINTLAKRMGNHRAKSVKRAANLYNVVQGDWDNWYIELYENYSCNNKKELVKREGEVIRQIATINNRVAGRTRKEYYEESKDKIVERDKKYRQNNREKIAENKKEYYQNNRDEILEKSKEKITCNICGCEINKYHLKEHQRTKKCMNYNVTIN